MNTIDDLNILIEYQELEIEAIDYKKEEERLKCEYVECDLQQLRNLKEMLKHPSSVFLISSRDFNPIRCSKKLSYDAVNDVFNENSEAEKDIADKTRAFQVYHIRKTEYKDFFE